MLVRRLVLSVFATVLALSPTAASAQDDGSDAPPGSLVQQLITAAEESLGDRSTVAVVRAADRGYDLLQVIEGLMASSVAVDGNITDDDGALLPPTLAPSGVIAENGGAGPAGGAARTASASGEQIGIDLLENGVQKTSKRLDTKDDLGERAERYDASLDVFTMLAVLVVIDSGYTIEQVILDGIMENGFDIDLDGSIVILDGKGRVLPPGGDEPSLGDDAESARAVDQLMDDVADAVAGEDPLAVTDGSFKRQYTLTVEAEFTDDEGGTGTVKGKLNLGELKDLGKRVAGRGTGRLLFDNKVGCSLSEGDTTSYPYSVRAPVRLAVFGNGEPGGQAKLELAVAGTGPAKVTGDESALCIEVVRDTADFYAQLISFPAFTVRLRDGATATADNKSSDEPFAVSVTASVKEI